MIYNITEKYYKIVISFKVKRFVSLTNILFLFFLFFHALVKMRQ